MTALALYVTGSSNTDLPALQAALSSADNASLDRLSRSAAVAALLPRLPWPEGKEVVARLCQRPGLYMKLSTSVAKGAPGLNEYLFEPERFRAGVDGASADELKTELPPLLGQQPQGWSLLSATPRTDGVVRALLSATNAAWRAGAVYTLSLRDDPTARPDLERALSDSNAWVRIAAVSGLSRTVKDRAARERLIAPLLADPDNKVSRMALMGLLERETASAAGIGFTAGFFEYEQIHAFPSTYEPTMEQRPVAVLEEKPAFLAEVQKMATNPAAAEAPLAALVLAQFGDFSGLDQMLKLVATGEAGKTEADGFILTAIGLSQDSKYLPALKRMVASAKEQYELQRLLQALKGFSGPEARELRLDINRQMRRGAE